MRFTWDPRKSEETLQLRRFDFAFAARIFEQFVVEYEDRRRDYGELRVVAVGIVDDIGLTIVYTERENDFGEAERRIISARRSNKKERRAYASRKAEQT